LNRRTNGRGGDRIAPGPRTDHRLERGALAGPARLGPGGHNGRFCERSVTVTHSLSIVSVTDGAVLTGRFSGGRRCRRAINYDTYDARAT